MLNCSSQTALVTGGSHGIGLAIARELVSQGATVRVIDRESPPAEEGLSYSKADVTDRASLEHAFQQAGAPDIVVANAGAVAFQGLLETDPDGWQRILAVNLTGVFHTVQLAAQSMKQRRRGSIVLTASTNSYDGESNQFAYNASKAGVLGILHTAANELGPYGIRVNAVAPGLIRTRLTEAAFQDEAFARAYFRQIPLGRGGLPEEVAKAAVFLASEAASYITGAALLVDGGQMAAKFGTWGDADRWDGSRWNRP